MAAGRLQHGGREPVVAAGSTEVETAQLDSVAPRNRPKLMRCTCKALNSENTARHPGRGCRLAATVELYGFIQGSTAPPRVRAEATTT